MKPLLPAFALTFLVALNAVSWAQAASPADTAAPKTSPAAQPAGAAPAAATPTSGPARLSADPVVICRDVKDRAPVSPAESFGSDVGALYCFCKVTGSDSTRVYHRWYVGDKMVFEFPIPVLGSSWRCWSRKTVAPSWDGECRVDVVTESGDVIGSAKFTLTKAPAAPAAAKPQG